MTPSRFCSRFSLSPETERGAGPEEQQMTGEIRTERGSVSTVAALLSLQKIPADYRLRAVVFMIRRER